MKRRDRRRARAERPRRVGYVEAHRIEEGDAVHRVGHPRDDEANHLLRRVNLSQGFPDFPAPAIVKDAACAAINADVNQYAVTWGARPLREAVAREFTRRYGLDVIADEQVTVCCGSTEAMMATMMAIIDPGDEVVIFEPFYENYGPDAILSGAAPRYVAAGRTGRSIRTSRRGIQRQAKRSHHTRTTRPGRGSARRLETIGALAQGTRSPSRRDLQHHLRRASTYRWRRSREDIARSR